MLVVYSESQLSTQPGTYGYYSRISFLVIIALITLLSALKSYPKLIGTENQPQKCSGVAPAGRPSFKKNWTSEKEASSGKARLCKA